MAPTELRRTCNKSGITAEAIHGDKSQNARQRALANFKNNATRVLVATDIAARGIDVADLSFVINFRYPKPQKHTPTASDEPEERGKPDWALSFCDREERDQLSDINRIATQKLTVVEHPFN